MLHSLILLSTEELARTPLSRTTSDCTESLCPTSVLMQQIFHKICLSGLHTKLIKRFRKFPSLFYCLLFAGVNFHLKQLRFTSLKMLLVFIKLFVFVSSCMVRMTSSFKRQSKSLSLFMIVFLLRVEFCIVFIFPLNCIYKLTIIKYLARNVNHHHDRFKMMHALALSSCQERG